MNNIQSNTITLFKYKSQQGLLVTYLIPRYVGRGVRLGSESSSGSAGAAAGGVWESGNLEIRKFGNLGTWEPGNLELWKSGTWKYRNLGSKKVKHENSQSQNLCRLKSEVGGLSSTGKSFRVVRACARCVCLVR